ncbi:MAG: 2-oxoacid:acceptor oxidoreductase subunit alpha [Gammaproteobacteria bacterium]
MNAPAKAIPIATEPVPTGHPQTVPRESLESAVVRFAGDSGDGMQLTGGQFTLAAALSGNDLATFPDFPAEIRAPTGTLFGVSSFQINFGARTVRTAGDQLDVLVSMNPAALKTNIGDLREAGLLIVDSATFDDKHLRKAGYASDPLQDGTLDRYRVLALDISGMTKTAVDRINPESLSNKERLRTKNMWALGLSLWLFDRDPTPVQSWLEDKFQSLPDVAAANTAALRAGNAYAETVELPAEIRPQTVPPAKIAPGLYRNIAGSEALCLGLATGAHLAGLPLLYCSYPITPASSMLHMLTRMAEQGVTTFQAEDEIAAVCAAIGASYAGVVGVTGSSGPGISLKTEAIGLAVAAELPLIVVNAQRGGPSTGLPTKTEQSDLYQAVFGRNADAPLIVLAARSACDCFDTAVEAVRLATRYMTPVMLLTDGYLANASEPWKLPDVTEFEPFEACNDRLPVDFQPFARDPETLARPWVRPGTPGGAHRLGGIERAAGSGNISYDPDNHQLMTAARRDKVLGVARQLPVQTVEEGPDSGPLAILGWGSTYGPISRAVLNLNEAGVEASQIHLRHIWPLPSNLGELLGHFDRVLVPEMNDGQLVTLLRAEYLVDAHPLSKVTGKPFKVAEIERAARELL